MMQKLAEAIRKKEAPVCVGLDTQLTIVPKRITDAAYKVYGMTLEGAGEALAAFNRDIIDAIYDIVPAVKLQIAMYEQFGIPGLAAYRDTIEYAKKKDLIVIGDVKRGDIGSTSAAYARAHLGRVQVGGATFRAFDTDIITVNPYFGTDGIEPFISVCAAENKGIFILVKTSNPSGAELQDRRSEGYPIYEHIASGVNVWGEDVRGGAEFSSVGAVVAATYPGVAERLRELMPHTMFLVPGYGAQGGTAESLRPYFTDQGEGVIVNSSRAIIGAWRDEKYAHLGTEAVGEAARVAVGEMIVECNAVLQ
ncbi:MAG: orotidine-5'-phosphate decarboxylase [Lachnospiraceae bacterium]|nr:orotidine-5'-phosphate decarboxylase [Lachnospiraceae bacterium]